MASSSTVSRGADGRAGPEDGSAPAAVRGPGRPRNAGYDRMILDAALEILIESGYAGFTIEGLAARTGVSRPTIYRRWPSRAALATAALDQGFRRVCAPDTGSVQEDLRAFQRERMARMNLPAHRPVVSGLVADSVADPDLAAAFADWYQHRHAGVDVILRRAIARGELPQDVDVDLVKDLLLGPLFARAVVQGRPLEPSLADETTDAVLAGIRAGGLRTKHSGVHDDGNT